MKFKFLLSILVAISFYLLTALLAKSYAYMICDTNRCGLPTCPTSCTTSNPGICAEGANSGSCPYCGASSGDCCSGASPWTQYSASCVQNGTDQFGNPTCTWVWVYNTKDCSIGDKCVNAGDTTLQAGQCGCGWGPTYKTCCDSNGNQNACNQFNSDGVYPDEGTCPNLTVFCGGSGQPACGQPACDSIAPPQTVQGTIKDANTGTALANVSVHIHNSSKNSDVYVTTNSSGVFSNNTLVKINNNFTVSPNTSAGSAPCNNGYICGNGWSPTSPNPYTESNSSGCSYAGGNVWNCNFTYTQGSIGGTVYIDYNHNGTIDAEDTTAPSGITITDTTSGKSTTTGAGGTYTISGLSQGSHTLSITIPSGYAADNNTTTATVTIGPNSTTANFMITPLYTISGEICNDTGMDGSCLESGEPQLSNAGSVTITPTNNGTAKQTASQANYLSGASVISGTYTVAYSPTNGYYFTASKVPNKVLPPFTVSVGQSATSGYNCSVPTAGTTDASCSSHNVINLNFAVSNLQAWFQGNCTDLRLQSSGLDDHLPNNGTCTDPVSGVSISNSYANVCVSNASGVGVYFAGSNAPTFGYNGGQASQPNYLVEAPYSENFTSVSGINRTSYQTLLDTVHAAGITPVDLSGTDPVSGLPYCGTGGLTNCDFESNLPDGVYIVPSTANSGNLTLNLSGSMPDPGNYKGYVFLVSGQLTINSSILVPQTSSAVFASQGDIVVSANVGEPLTSYNSMNPDLEGLYSAGGNFIIKSNSTSYTCGAGGVNIDKRLNILGSVVAGGTIQNQRELCKYDASCPTATYSTSYNYLLNAPDVVKHRSTLWQETAPSGQ